MTFAEQVTATLVGTISGFLFSLMLFWVKEYFGKTKLQKHLIENLQYEFEYNNNLFKKYSQKISECIEAVNAGTREVYLSLNYSFVASYFALQFYREGLASKYLHYEDIKRWNDVLINHGAGSEQYVLDNLALWRKGEVEADRVFTALKYERDQLNHAIEMIDYLKKKIVP